ncbi:MAG: carbamoyl phosphate synthase small subunit, partial [Alphaproteobacteria bacterium]|nr:carbamoyl phosphate synthase small subunit [Alphaproteobacteria bacterium]
MGQSPRLSARNPRAAAILDPASYTAALILGDGTIIRGRGLGAKTTVVGEVCFNTAMSGYQETISDPSYAGQIITFTFPHIGNVGTNQEDVETATPAARGVILRAAITEPSNFRALEPLDRWLSDHGIPGICGIDTRRLTRRIRDGGAP